MKKYISLMFAAASLAMTSCIEEIDPQGNASGDNPPIVTEQQAGDAPGSFNNFVSGLTGNLCGNFIYSSDEAAIDFGYPSMMIMNDVMGQDMALSNSGDWYITWYGSGISLGPGYAYCQYPITYYYGWIKDCNTVINIGGETPADDRRYGVGIAYAMRAFLFEDLARMYCNKPYSVDPQALSTVLQVPQEWSEYYVADLTHNPRATNEQIWKFIISDLDKAEELLDGYKRDDVYTPDVSVVYGLKARAYLEMCDWANAEKYAKMAQNGYRMMTAGEYTSRDYGFNTPNAAWMFGLTFKSNDKNITLNDGDSSWGSWMINEIDPVASGCGYSANYRGSKLIDKHLYSTIPATDFRRNCFVDFAIDDLATKAEKIEALKAYSDYPDWVYETGYNVQETKGVGGIQLKFRAAGGAAGHANQYVGWVVAVPLMRVEEMYLIEAEAAGMQSEARGIQLLTEFAKQRDPQFVYGQHNEAYGNPSTSAFQNECWWQRRIEFWGEGIATYDIKRLNKGVIRNYQDTNHMEDYRWNIGGYDNKDGMNFPQWMTRCYVGTESDYNYSLVQNPTPIAPENDSPEYTW